MTRGEDRRRGRDIAHEAADRMEDNAKMMKAKVA
jgi:hypothetical protein